MVGEVSLPDSKEPWYGGHQLVVYPNSTHRVVDSRVDHHRRLVGIIVGNLFVHLEEVPIASLYNVLTETLDSRREVQEDSQPSVIHTIASVTTLLSRTASHVTRDEITEGWITTLEVIVTIFLLDLGRT